MITAGYLGLGIFYFPRPLVSAAGRAGIYGLWIDGLIAFGLMRLLFRMSHLIPNETLAGYASALLSKPVGYLLGVFTILYHLAIAISATVLFSFVLGNIFLPSTPLWAIDGILVLTGCYIALSGLAGLARTLQASYIPLLVITFFSAILASVAIRHPVLLEPGQDVAVLSVLVGAYHQFLIFIGFEVSVTLYPFVHNSQRAQAERYSYYALGGILVALTVVYEIVMAVFGPEAVSELRWPLVSTYRIISLSGFYISKLGTLLIVLWTIIIVAFVAVRLWCLAHDLMALLRDVTPVSYQLSLVIMALTAISGALIFPNAKIADIFNVRFVIPLGFLYLVGTPLVVLTVANIRKHMVLNLRTLSEKSPES